MVEKKKTSYTLKEIKEENLLLKQKLLRLLKLFIGFVD